MSRGEEVPSWYADALATPVLDGKVEVDGVAIAYRSWGDPDAPCTILVHGGAAHSRWWDHVAPHLTQGRHVVALDLSGHGDSGRRTSYDLEAWSREVMGVAAQVGSGRPRILGHSMGGFVALTAARDFAGRIDAIATIDSPIRDLSPQEEAARRSRGPGNVLRTYPDRDAIISRFRPLPDDGPTLPYVVAHVAAESVRRHDDGWTWKFDPTIFGSASMPLTALAPIDLPCVALAGARGLVSPAMLSAVVTRLGPRAASAIILDAGHHVMLDQPVALIAALDTLLASWEAR